MYSPGIVDCRDKMSEEGSDAIVLIKGFESPF